jgi:hypothetical protein
MYIANYIKFVVKLATFKSELYANIIKQTTIKAITELKLILFSNQFEILSKQKVPKQKVAATTKKLD